MNKRKGISLIVLVITILVMIILAGVVIVSLSKNNPVKKAKEATFKTDVSTFEGDLSFYLANSLATDSTLKMEDVDAAGYSEIKKVINSFAEKYADKFEVVDGKLIYIGEDKDELVWIGELGISTKAGIVNAPVLSSGMIPIKYNGTKWVICDSKDPEWYNYEGKQWANVMLSDGKYKTITPGTVVEDADLGSMFVWIPRYAYSINKYKTAATGTEGKTQLIHDITFLTGTSDSDVDGKTYAKSYDAKAAQVGKPTPKIVHPGFTLGNKELSGIWFAKFEASMQGDMNKNNENSCNIVKDNTIAIVPNKLVWRFINIGRMFDNCFNMRNSGNIYGITNVDSHLMKNTEWGAVAYLSTSKYGIPPTFSGEREEYEINKFNVYSGGGKNSNYKINVSQSTTGNVTGIFDMNGGCWEYVAAYWENKNDYFNTFASNAFTNGIVKEPYTNYFNKYEVGNNEKDPSLFSTVYNANFDDVNYGNKFRKKVTTDRYNLLSNSFGDALYEVIKQDKYSYFGKLTDNKNDWLINDISDVPQYGKTEYFGDYAVLGNTFYSFLLRGGCWWDTSGAGLFTSHAATGGQIYCHTFRPVLTIQ